MQRHRIEKVLVANRGEIAVRVMRTCRRMGVATVAVFSDADADAPFARLADEAVRIGPPPAIESYLDIEKILGAAKLTGADAIHPGYGFLAENPEFCAACGDAGVSFIGPSPEVIRLLGSKLESKRRVGEVDVPVIPGGDGADQSAEALSASASAIGFPVLLKASGGGGGKGMRIVREAGDLEAAIDSARRESKSAFGDDTLLVEKYIDRPRHVEFQILGDFHGNVIHLFERECSIQRRHQKIVEETPSPVVTPELRERMGRAAVAVGKAVGYQNAGTVEFMLAPSGEFFFLEVNTRLQVEHPVTEMVTGIDLVREQILIAQGEEISIDPDALSQSGSAIECRLYAEDPQNDFLPSSGRILDWHQPQVEGLRIDSGVEGDQDVSIHYDPILAKVICHGPSRAEAIQRMMRSLRLLSVQGIVTNRDFLLRVLEHPEFRAGNIDTHFLETYADDLRADPPAESVRQRAAIAATLAAYEVRRRERTILPRLEPGWHSNRFGDEWVDYRAFGEKTSISYRNLGKGKLRFEVNGTEHFVSPVSYADKVLVYEDGVGHRRRFRVLRDGQRHFVHSVDGALTFDEAPRFPDPEAAEVEGGCVAPMPGKVVKVLVEVGQEVKAGDTVAILEAMKMEHTARAPDDGVVAQVLVAEGEQVDAGALIAVIKAAE